MYTMDILLPMANKRFIHHNATVVFHVCCHEWCVTITSSAFVADEPWITTPTLFITFTLMISPLYCYHRSHLISPLVLSSLYGFDLWVNTWLLIRHLDHHSLLVQGVFFLVVCTLNHF